MSHLGTRVSALLDGRLAPEVEERRWAPVHRCHPCRDLVEREGMVKTRLAAWSLDGGTPGGPLPERLRSSLLDPTSSTAAAWMDPVPARGRAALVLGGGVAGAVGATVVGVLALGAAPSDAPLQDRRPPVTQLTRPATGSWTDAPRPVGGRAPPPRPPRRPERRGARGR